MAIQESKHGCPKEISLQAINPVISAKSSQAAYENSEL